MRLLNSPQKNEADIYDQRERVDLLKEKLNGINSPEAKQLLSVADMLVKKSVWIVGGDGWAYDIGYGGLDHVHGQRTNVNSWCSIPRSIRTPADSVEVNASRGSG